MPSEFIESIIINPDVDLVFNQKTFDTLNRMSFGSGEAYKRQIEDRRIFFNALLQQYPRQHFAAEKPYKITITRRDYPNRIYTGNIILTKPIDTIDPMLADNPEQQSQAELLDKLFQQHKKTKQFFQHVPYSIKVDGKTKQYYLKYSLNYRSRVIRHTRREKNSIDMFDLNKPIGSQSIFGRIYKSIDTLHYAPKAENKFSKTKRSESFKKRKQRIIKVIIFDKTNKKSEEIQSVKDEYEALSQTPYAHAKTPTFGINPDKDFVGVLVSHLFTGMDISKYLDSEDFVKLNYAQRLKLSANLLRALKEQVHDRGYIHRDIKPANIIVDPNTLQVKIIDFGIARKIEIEDNRPCGTAAYISPEGVGTYFIAAHTSEKSDLWAMSLVIAPLFNRNRTKDKDENPTDWTLKMGLQEEGNKIFNAKMQVNYTLMFQYLSSGGTYDFSLVGQSMVAAKDASADQLQAVRARLNLMGAWNEEQRNTVPEALEFFENEYLKAKYNPVTEEIKNAYQLAVKINAQLQAIATNVKKAKDSQTQFSEINRIAKLITDGLKQIDPIDPKSEAYNEFIETLNIEFLKDKRYIEEILGKRLSEDKPTGDKKPVLSGAAGKEEDEDKPDNLTAETPIPRKDVVESINFIVNDFRSNLNTLMTWAKETTSQAFMLYAFSLLNEDDEQMIRDNLQLKEDILVALNEHAEGEALLDDIVRYNSHLRESVTNLEDRVTQAQTKFQTYIKKSDEMQKYQSLIQAVHADLEINSLMTPEQQELYHLINRIKGAMLLYIQKSLTFENIQKKDRAASEERFNGMRKILNLMAEAVTKEKGANVLAEDIEKELAQWTYKSKTMQKWMPQFFFHSELRNMIRKEIKASPLPKPKK